MTLVTIRVVVKAIARVKKIGGGVRFLGPCERHIKKAGSLGEMMQAIMISHHQALAVSTGKE